MIKAPYNFVPLADRVFFPDWADKVTQDLPFADGEDAVIRLELTNRTPLFTRNGSGRGEKDCYSAHVGTESGKRYYIPGTTIKGCIRSIMEILSFAKMGPYNNSSFAMPREFDTKKSNNSFYQERTKKVYCGWLRQKGYEYEIVQCKKGVQKINKDALRKFFPDFDEGADHETAERKQKSVMTDGNLYPVILVENEEISYKENNKEKWVPAGEYQIVCTGHMEGKNHEYLFSTSTDETPIPVSKEVFDVFDSVHSKTKYYNGHGDEPGFLKTRLREGKDIPVFFTKQQNKIDAIGIAFKLRYPYAESVSKAVNRCYSELPDPKQMDLPEVIFGCIDKTEGSLRGRVSFGNAFCTEIIPDEALIEQRGVLGQPSASYYPLYLQQKASPYITYQDPTCRIAGRKRYRVIMGNRTNALPAGNGNENTITEFKALPADKTFTCYITVHNLRKAEIGALLSAITMHDSDNTFLNLGLAKSFGFGKMSCRMELCGFKHDKQEYLRAFEVALAQEGFELGISPNLDKMISIASEHEASSMTMMETPEEYENNKSNDTFSTLSESPRHIVAILSHDEAAEIYRDYQSSRILRNQARKAQEEAKRKAVEEQKQAEALRQDKLLLLDRNRKVVTDAKEAGNWNDALAALLECKKIALEIGESIEVFVQDEALIQSKLKGKTSFAVLNEQYPDGRYKVIDFKGIKNRTDTLMRKKGLASIPNEELKELYTALKRAKSLAKGKEQTDYSNSSSRIWQYIGSITSTDVAQQWHSTL